MPSINGKPAAPASGAPGAMKPMLRLPNSAFHIARPAALAGCDTLPVNSHTFFRPSLRLEPVTEICWVAQQI